MNWIRLGCVVGVFLIIQAIGCGGSKQGGTFTGNALVSIKITGIQSQAQAALHQALSVGNNDITTALIVLDRLRFRKCEESSDDSEIRFDGPFIVDLLDSEPVPGLQNINVPRARYCKIEMTIKEVQSESLSSGVPATLADKSLLIEGTQSEGVRFQITSDFDEEFELENQKEGFVIDDSGGVYQFFIAFNLDEWFSGIDLSGANVQIDADSSGSIIYINEERNGTIHESIEKRIKESADLFEDEDDDGELEDDERDDSLAEGKELSDEEG